MNKLLCATTALCLISTSSFAATRILFIGNSFTYGAHSAVQHYQPDQVHDLNPPDKLGRTVGGVPALFKELTKEAGLDYDVSLETVGGKGLDYHLADKRAMIDKPWDVVIGHGYSTMDEAHPGDPALLISSTRQMADMLAAKNPSVKFYLLATWSRADKIFPADAPAPWKGTPVRQMGEDVAKGYDAAARNAGVTGVIPLGRAWNMGMDKGVVDDNPYDDTGASKMNLWAYDSYHGSSFGYFLEALMDFGKVTGLDPLMFAEKGKDHVAEDLGISPKQALALMQLAHDGLAAQGQTFVALNK